MTASTTPTYFDDPRHRESERLTLEAEQALKADDVDGCMRFYRAAAELEEAVALDVPKTLPRTRGTLAISAVALWLKALEFEKAKKLAEAFLNEDGLTKSARPSLRELVKRCEGDGK